MLFNTKNLVDNFITLKLLLKSDSEIFNIFSFFLKKNVNLP